MSVRYLLKKGGKSARSGCVQIRESVDQLNIELQSLMQNILCLYKAGSPQSISPPGELPQADLLHC